MQLNQEQEDVVIAPWRLALLAMAREIEKRGFCRLVDEDLDGSISLIGASKIVGSSFSVEDLDKAYDQFSRIIETNPSEWGERKERTQQEVVSKLRKAAYQVM